VLLPASAEEQFEIEAWFRMTRSLRSIYWIGLEKSTNLYFWQDGSVVNNGNVSNADPCEHETLVVRFACLAWHGMDRRTTAPCLTFCRRSCHIPAWVMLL
jgi:hypothetical protein